MKRRLPAKLSLSLVTCLIAADLSFGAIEQLDQFHIDPEHPHAATFPSFHSTGTIAQTFTVGLRGVLSRIDLGLVRFGDQFTHNAMVDVARVTGGKPDFTASGVLATRIVLPSQFPSYDLIDPYRPYFSVSIDFSDSHFQVKPNDELAIILRSDNVYSSSNHYNVWLGQPLYPGFTPYLRGEGFGYDRVTGTVGNLYGDFHFRTFVLVPEPATAALVAICCVGLATHRIPRKQPLRLP